MKEVPDQLLRDAKAGGPKGIRAASRLMTLLENEPALQVDFLRKTGFGEKPRLILGITGAPGSGKSTLTDAMLASYRDRDPDARIGVIAVDPSSPFSGGAILADRVRMMRHSPDPGIFIRSMASRGHLGGLSLGVNGVLSVMAWMGMDLVILETVGVGQSEVEVVKAADLVAVVLAPGFGDSMQLIKAGLMEIGDILVVNKADCDGAAALHAEVLAALQLESRPCLRDVALVSASEQNGIRELLETIEKRAEAESARTSELRKQKYSTTIRNLILEMAKTRLAEAMNGSGRIGGRLRSLENGEEADWGGLVDEILTIAARGPAPLKTD